MERKQLEQKILEVMRFWACGSKNAKAREFILEKINEGLTDINKVTDRYFRDVYAEMSQEHLLGSCEEIGYFIIINEHDAYLADQSLLKKSVAIAIRRNRLYSLVRNKLHIDMQPELPL